jgi:hypothetical protein
LRGLDLNQRPLGYEGTFALHTGQKEPTGASNDGDLRGDDVVPCWFASVALRHRNFIAGSDRGADRFRFTAFRTFVHIYRISPIQKLPRRREAQGEPLGNILSA